MIDPRTTIAFIGGGNMANAIIGGLLQQGTPTASIDVIEPLPAARQALADKYQVRTHEQAGEFLRSAGLVVWAVKPQIFKDVALALAPTVGQALHLSVAAGIGSDSIALWLGTERIARAMPNTPALIGLGMTGLYARPTVSAAERQQIERIATAVGDALWVEHEALLEAVTAVSGSGPAYFFYVLEAMTEAGVALGLNREQAYRMAVQTARGASELAHRSDEPAEVLRQRVTSKGGTTHEAISALEAGGLKPLFAQAMQACARRARELGEEFGKG
jgi:pyrroline-5-carboxylate reductase